MNALASVVIALGLLALLIWLDRRGGGQKLDGGKENRRHSYDSKNYSLSDAIGLGQTYIDEVRADHAQQTSHNRLILVISVITLVLIAIYTGLTYAQWRATRESFADVQRAFVFVKEIKQGPTEIQSQGRMVWEFYPVWENSGTTPADEVQIYSHIIPMEGPIPIGYKFLWQEGHPFLLAPKSTIEGIHGWVPADDIEHRFRAPFSTYHVVVYAEARYNDIFGSPHKTESCSDFVGVHIDHVTDKIDQFRFVPCDYHNCEDERCNVHKSRPHDTPPWP